MTKQKIELSFEADKLTIGITEQETQLHSADKLLASLYKLIDLLNKSSISTKLILAILVLAPIAITYLYKQ